MKSFSLPALERRLKKSGYLGENVSLLSRKFCARTLLDVQQEEQVVPAFRAFRMVSWVALCFEVLCCVVCCVALRCVVCVAFCCVVLCVLLFVVLV